MTTMTTDCDTVPDDSTEVVGVKGRCLKGRRLPYNHPILPRICESRPSRAFISSISSSQQPLLPAPMTDMSERCRRRPITRYDHQAPVFRQCDHVRSHSVACFGPVNWPPRSCDLTPLDYFLWGYVKSLVYADKPQTLDHLEDNIRRVIADIRPQMLEKVIENWTSRLDYIRASRGSPMPEIIFKM
ncbi:hypothetical protein TNCV_2344341 [Trichonephila clavipes]|nr:hypothetical protein TNCV_2344341 [Trichonephila clavipes]